VTRHNIPIQIYPLKNRVNTGIKFAPLYESMDACIMAGCDLERWLDGNYADEFMHLVIAFFRMKNSIESHSIDAQQRKAELDAKRKSGS